MTETVFPHEIETLTSFSDLCLQSEASSTKRDRSASGRSNRPGLDGCPGCLNYLATYRETVRMGRCLCDEPDGPVPDDVPEDLVRAILAARQRATSGG